MAPRPADRARQRAFGNVDEFSRLAKRAEQAVAAQRAKDDRQASITRRNLRALSIAPIKEPLPRMLPFESSRVAEAGYSTDSHTLYVRFVDGTPWQYNNVEPNVWRNFRRSASAGRYINRVLNNYSYGRSNF
jgi:hypothetical protein